MAVRPGLYGIKKAFGRLLFSFSSHFPFMGVWGFSSKTPSSKTRFPIFTFQARSEKELASYFSISHSHFQFP